MQPGYLILKYLACYLAFFIVLLLSKSGNGYKLFDEEGPARNSGALMGLQIAGILWLGIVPYFVFEHFWTSIVFGKQVPGFFPALILILLLIVVVLFAGIQAENLFGRILSNQFPVKIFNQAFVLRYILLRFLFICAYEIFFRGYLLTDSIHFIGTAKAVLLNVSLYTLLHAPADKKEMIACIPFGTLLCLVCLWLNAAWPAIVLHVSLSLTYEINLVRKFSKPINAFL